MTFLLLLSSQTNESQILTGFIFDLKNTKISKEINTTLPVGDGILKTVRAGQFNQDTVRVVLDLEEIKDFKVFMLEDPARLIIDVYGHKKRLPKLKI